MFEFDIFKTEIRYELFWIDYSQTHKYNIRSLYD